MDQQKKTADLKAYQKAYRDAHPKVKEDVNAYMKNYIKKAENIECTLCGGCYKSYSKYKHDATQKHLKALIDIKEKQETSVIIIPDIIPTPQAKSVDMSSLDALKGYESDSDSDSGSDSTDSVKEDITFTLPAENIDAPKVVEFLEEHFKKSAKPTRSAESKTPRTNKNMTVWNKVSKIVGDKTWKYLGDNFMTIVEGCYDKPSTQADTVVMLKLVLSHFAGLNDTDKERMNELNKTLKQSHIAKQVSLPANGLTYAEMKARESDDDTTIALMMRLYNGDIPALRIHDWINAVVGKTDDLNEINIRKKVMIRRIVKIAEIDKKTQKVKEDIIELPKSLIEFIQKRKIKGALFGDHSARTLSALLLKEFPNRKANPRYFRDLYSTTVTPTFSKEKLEKVLGIMNHKALTHASYYRKTKEGDPLLQLVAGK